MPLSRFTTWRIRPATTGSILGVETNGGGYDPSVSGGTDLTLNPTSHNFSDLVATGGNTITSVTGFSGAIGWAGNILRLRSGTGITAGYYCVLQRIDNNTLQLDRSCGTFTGGVGDIGGAFRLKNVVNGGNTSVQPIIPSPLASGHTAYLHGSSAPGSHPLTSGINLVLTDYSVASEGGLSWHYWSLPNGSTGGDIKFVGIDNPHFVGAGALFYGPQYHTWESVCYRHAALAYNSVGFVAGACTSTKIQKSLLDQNGHDGGLFNSATAVDSCIIQNSGTTASGSTRCYAAYNAGGSVSNCYFKNLRSNVIVNCNSRVDVQNNIFENCLTAIYLSSVQECKFLNNTFRNCRDAVVFNQLQHSNNVIVKNNRIENSTRAAFMSETSADASIPLPSTINNNYLYNNYSNYTSCSSNNLQIEGINPNNNGIATPTNPALRGQSNPAAIPGTSELFNRTPGAVEFGASGSGKTFPRRTNE